MTKHEFIKQYCCDSEIDEAEFHASQVALPCNCGDRGCEGWAAVGNNLINIKAHNELYQGQL